MILEISASSNKGLIRDGNEDIILVGNTTLRDDCMNTKTVIGKNDSYAIAVADGIGGCNAGEVASKETVEIFEELFSNIPSGLTLEELKERIDEIIACIDTHLDQLSQSDKRLSGLGTTLVAILFYEERICWINCGDSRIYRLRDGVLAQLSTDHSLDQMTNNPCDSHILTNAIGPGIKAKVDFTNITDSIYVNDTYLLCSDGFSDMVSNDEAEKLLNQTHDANLLVEKACVNGGRDNISVCIVRVCSK